MGNIHNYEDMITITQLPLCNFHMTFTCQFSLNRKSVKFTMLGRAWNFFTDYTGNSSVHGVKYVGEKNRHISERIFWVFSVVVCFIGCAFTINEIYSKWQANPVLVTLAEKGTPVSSIPFPAITICPMTKFYRNIVNFTELTQKFKDDKLNTLTSDELKNFDAAVHVCDQDLSMTKLKSDLHGGEIVERLDEISIKLTDTLLYCTMRGMESNCSELFTEIVTEEGFCFTFNMLDLSELIKQDK